MCQRTLCHRHRWVLLARAIFALVPGAGGQELQCGHGYRIRQHVVPPALDGACVLAMQVSGQLVHV